ncbi:hypothetical protein NEPAR06_1286 [Nematocida parisii]|uniref:Uncharacterized protein n=1 Tax=Nematocida parisii (strain ERTm3) TaxID=935791 RepID=I3EHM5_NEMP3|nr:uncharacterized protein NEPG_00503 [Nematocida parisii ERTm1]EIJ88722.1 hypothetical protein NEQG_01412 [Nematocida parisii ERTm3]KAI5127012.1 hypothetical protein NEPAR03_0760 [Nematocida parisii]EIJ94978.1 hypothetical protein NEPG_00503 [Nematocida parisii ERTm1]KAI5128328.1 hypothetical protein NEPAR08_1192 [Nematocida parisii]KAI5140803.1 hypothetical protein NEPAR04_0520 [Nematocida parisii]|eukprot:XP_013058334.1 hypothetical protein NEPG_00503 [Nematocida parisii ERTm1]
MDMFVKMKRLLLPRKRVEIKTERQSHTLNGFVHFQNILNSPYQESAQHIRRAEKEYATLIEEIEKAQLEKTHIFLLFTSLFKQLDALSFLSSSNAVRVQMVREEVENLLIQQMYIYVEYMAQCTDTMHSSLFIVLLGRVPIRKAVGIKMRYFSRRMQSMDGKALTIVPEELVSIIERECTRYCTLFGLDDLSEENLLVLDGFLFSIIRKNLCASQDAFFRFRECILMRARSSSGSSALLRRFNVNLDAL